MKKLLYITLFFLLFLTGCEKKSVGPAPESVFLVTDQITADGVKCGDGADEFKKAYGAYRIQVIYGTLGSSFVPTAISDIPFDKEITTVIANFFIDGTPVLEETICRENGIDDSGLFSLLSSSNYLRSHEVIYRYLAFDWSDGVITDITSGELNYNESYDIPMAE